MDTDRLRPGSSPPRFGLPDYAELYCLSNFSFLRGASHPEELVERAAELGYAALALTDECSLAGVVRAHVEALKLGLLLLVGSAMRVAADAGGPGFTLVALAQTREGYGNLAELVTLARGRAPKGSYFVAPADFDRPDAAHAHLRGLPGCQVLLVPEPGADPAQLCDRARWLADTFGARARLGLALLHRPDDERQRQAVLQAAQVAGLPVAAAGQVEMHRRSRKPLHDTLAAIRLGRPVAECGFDLAANAEQHLRTRMRLAALYPPGTLEETVRVARSCTFSLEQLRYEYPDEIVPAGETPASFLRRATYEGARNRFPGGTPPEVRDKIEHELALVAELRYEAYFLTVYDLVRFARKHGILCQGRGSAANSVVCYCLGITEADPQCIDALFERFISKARNEPPDIDVDFEHQRREEVIQYIYGKYGRRRAALTAVVISYRPRSVLRDTGKALGVDPDVIDAVAKAHQWWDGRQALLQRLAACGLDPASPTARHWAELAEILMGFPRHLSQHPGGFVISRGPLCRMVPIENAAMAGRSVVQWDKDDLDALGMLKVDVLALGMLSVLRRTLEWVAWRRGRPFVMQDIPQGDDPTYDMICEADTVGVFQIESRAQMSMLPRLRPRTYYDLVVEVAIVRPGPIQGGMVHPYLQRRKDPGLVDYPGPEVRAVLERTLGVPIFQEQVMQIAIKAAGFSPDEADRLRRSMAAWKRKGGVDRFRDKLIAGLLARNYQREFAEALFRQIQGFGEYGFPESHAASFALLAYCSAWLKRHEPEAFLAGLLNSQPMGFYSPSQLVQDARRHGVHVLEADVAASDWEATLEARGARPAVRLGLNRIRGLSEAAARRIVAARAEPGFADIPGLARQAALERRELDALAAAGALRSLAGHRRQAHWQAAAAVAERGLLRHAAPAETESPRLPAPSESQDMEADYRSLGLTLGRHPLALLRAPLRGMRFATAGELRDRHDGRLVRACGLVTGRQRPPTAKGTVFVTLEDETGSVNVIVHAPLAERQRRELLGAPLLGVHGVWRNESGVRHLVAGRLVDLSSLLGDLVVRSRDFQ